MRLRVGRLQGPPFIFFICIIIDVCFIVCNFVFIHFIPFIFFVHSRFLPPSCSSNDCSTRGARAASSSTQGSPFYFFILYDSFYFLLFSMAFPLISPSSLFLRIAWKLWKPKAPQRRFLSRQYQHCLISKFVTFKVKYPFHISDRREAGFGTLCMCPDDGAISILVKLQKCPMIVNFR